MEVGVEAVAVFVAQEVRILPLRSVTRISRFSEPLLSGKLKVRSKYRLRHLLLLWHVEYRVGGREIGKEQSQRFSRILSQRERIFAPSFRITSLDRHCQWLSVKIEARSRQRP